MSNHSVGPHELRIHNGTSDDAIVKLRNQQNRDVASIYVYAGARAALAGVPDGAFAVLFATGKRYAESCDRFLDDFYMWKFSGLQNFIRSREGNLVYTTVIEFTLHEVPSGNIDRRSISEEEWFKG